jgi:methyltransferase (TIGR00027 family)
MGAAYHRAAHRRLDPAPWILDDGVAGELLGEDLEARFEAATGRSAQRAAVVRAQLSTRARLAEDVAVAGLADDLNDYAILGAGLDTFAWRHPRAQEFTVWEIDHPETQTWKRRRLVELQLDEPANVRFIAVDLAVTPLGALELPTRATWNWLGVTIYLDKPTTAATLNAIAAASEAAVVVVDFALELEHCDELGRQWREQTASFAASVGERHLSSFTPEEACDLVSGAGLEVREVLDADELTKRYLRDQPDLRLAAASVFIVAGTGG